VQFGWPWLPSVILGGVLAVALAYAIGVPTLRLHGAYFAIATWALAEAIKQFALILNITGGTYGLSPPPVLSREMSYWLMLILMIGMTTTNLLIQRSKFGYGLRALSESETGAEVLGVNTPRYLLYAFLISALFPGLIGGIYGLWIGYVYPYDAFDGTKTDQMVVMTLLGGMGNYLGPLIGAVFLIAIFEVLWTYWSNVIYLIFLGLLIIFTVVFLPTGVVGLVKTKAPAWLSKIRRSHATKEVK
jgi:branched-chain amino acid transport system permease protein